MQKITPFLWFNDNAEEAAVFYTSVFQNSKINDIARFGDEVPGPRGKVMIVNFNLAGLDFSALNGGPEFSFTPSISFFVHCESVAQIDKLWAALSAGGEVLMEYDAYPFSEKFGWLVDRYGVSWQLFLDHTPQHIVPCLMFVGEQHGRAEEAINLYTSLFKNSSITLLDRYDPDQGEPASAVRHGRFILAGQEFVAMDSGLEHKFNFTPATSLYVNCSDQAEVDHFWYKLIEGGSPSQCGWLVDKFGVSWQIIPTILTELMSDPDAERAARVTEAMLKMTKIEISQLRMAYEMA